MNYKKKEENSFNLIGRCPRCGDHAFEYLRTHNHCVNCLYFQIKPVHESINEVTSAEITLAEYDQRKKRKCLDL